MSFEQYNYDKVGNRTSVRLSDGNTNTYQYDPLNRLRQLTYLDGQTVVYSYTRGGLKQQVVDSRGTTKYQYDNLNRTVLITQPTNLSVAYQWDASSNRTLMTTTAGTTRYAYDNAKRLTLVTDTLGAGNSYTYDNSGLRSGLILNNGASAININYGYDALSRLTNITQTLPSSSPITYSYTLDAVGNRKQVNESSGISNTWQYDDSNRLLTETRKLGVTITSTLYTYDKTGNRLQQTVNGSPVMTGTYNELDQLISDGTKQYTYDHRGNLTQITGGTKYKWDGADRLISATVAGGTATYTYDDAGHRVKQTQGITTTNYLWDEMSPYGDVVYESDGTTATNYTLGNGELISQKRGSNSTEYFLMDGHSGVRNLASNTGSILQSYNYDAFGNLQNFSGTLNTKYLYTGQQFDSLTSLYDLRARYYNPGQGRFLSRDTWPVILNNPIEFNRYGYTANNPTNKKDITGLNANYAIILRFSLMVSPYVAMSSAYITDAIAGLILQFNILGSKSECSEFYCLYYFTNKTTKNVGNLFSIYGNTIGVIGWLLVTLAFLAPEIPQKILIYTAGITLVDKSFGYNNLGSELTAIANKPKGSVIWVTSYGKFIGYQETMET